MRPATSAAEIRMPRAMPRERWSGERSPAKVERVAYPGLESFPQRELARRQMTDFDGTFAPSNMIYFVVKGGDRASSRLVNHCSRHAYTITLASFLPSRNENNAGSVLAALLPLQALTAAGLCVLILHHPTKGKPMPGQALASRQARRSTHSPSSMMRPLFSAIGMNSDGGISPRTGCVQRQSASTPTTVSPLLLTIG